MSDSARPVDPELGRLLLEELRRYEPALGPDSSTGEQRRALHALKGSAGIAGERWLSETLARLERRLIAGDLKAIADARGLLAEASAALAAGDPIAAPLWPEPPVDLCATPIDPLLHGTYTAEMQDRIERIDRALAAGDDVQAALAAYREVHAMKGAALAVSDEVTTWFCHGLEERLRVFSSSEALSTRALAELTRWRGVLAELVVAPDRGLMTLRRLTRSSDAPSRSPPGSSLQMPPTHPSLETAGEPDAPRNPVSEDATLRVPTATLDRLFERVRQFGQARAQVLDGAELVQGMAGRARSLRGVLAEALRLIGPPRPWGAPAAAIQRVEQTAREIFLFAERLERGSALLTEAAFRLRTESAAAHSDLAAIRTTSIAWLFDRVAAAVSAQARREGREVRLVFSGEETAIDRHVAEALFDPVLQLARNAVAHGLESASERALRGKPKVGSVHLTAQPRSGGLRLVVHDDGAGVNIADVRVRAIARGTISPEMARAADDQTLLALLFIPGFTTRDSADLLAGRGVGLDLALEAVHRLGGTIRLASQPGMGLTATLDIPFEPGLIKVLWLTAGGMTYALPVSRIRRILRASDPEARAAIPLAACVSGRRGELPARSSRLPPAPTSPPPSGLLPAGFAIALDPLREGGRTPVIAVERIGEIEEVALRGVSPLIATAGPYAGAIVRGNDLRLCLDAHALAELIGV